MPATRAEALHDICSIVSERIDVAALADAVRSDACGAVALFAGVVRDHHEGERVSFLEYEAYAPMAEEELRRIAAEMRQRWDLGGLAIVHRTGRLEIGETSVAIAVASEHRREALEACAYAIERVKESLPVWKKEHGERGGDWVIGDASRAADLPSYVTQPVRRSARRRAESLEPRRSES